GVPLLLPIRAQDVGARARIRPGLFALLARPLEHAGRDRGRCRGRGDDGRVPRRRRTLQARARRPARAALRSDWAGTDAARPPGRRRGREWDPSSEAGEAVGGAAAVLLRRSLSSSNRSRSGRPGRPEEAMSREPTGLEIGPPPFYAAKAVLTRGRSAAWLLRPGGRSAPD